MTTTQGAVDQIPIWLDCDTGHDDAFAILLAARHPKAHLLGVSTIFGNATLDNTTHNTRAILKAIGREEVPVYPGAAKPFCREAYHAPDIHGESGLDGTTCLPVPGVEERTDRTAVDAMYEALISTQKGTAWLVPTGALTNAALLFALYPHIADHLAGLSIMGGAIGGGFTNAPMGTVAGEGERFGNSTPWAEFNIYIDPESAKSIFTNEILAPKISLITLDLTHQFLATKEVQHELLHGIYKQNSSAKQSMLRKLFLEILTFFAKTYTDVFNISAGPPLHDPLAVAAALVPALFQDSHGERFQIEVVTDDSTGGSSSHLGRTIAKLLPKGAAGVRVPRGLAVSEIWSMLEKCLEASETQASSGLMPAVED